MSLFSFLWSDSRYKLSTFDYENRYFSTCSVQKEWKQTSKSSRDMLYSFIKTCAIEMMFILTSRAANVI